MSQPESTPTHDSSSPASHLMLTKLTAPAALANAVQRPRLLNALNQGMETKLTLLVAPTGYGKTTLLSDWVASLAAHTYSCAWLSLDTRDNDPARFWRYVQRALLPILGPASTPAYPAPCDPQEEQRFLSELCSRLAQHEPSFSLVLDDFHTIHNGVIHGGLARLIEHLPNCMHIVLSTRKDPELPLGLLRARGCLLELRAAELAFTSSESELYLNQIMGLNLPPELSAELILRTEGWIAGLQLAALSMKDRPDQHRFIAAFTGSHRFVLDYLTQEVLQHQPPEVHDFLLKTSILHQLTAPLVEAVVEQENGQQSLEKLERANLFIVPLDDHRQWYRYHTLFAELLRYLLKALFPDALTDLHMRAAAWYQANDYWEEALDHILNAGAFTQAVEMVEHYAHTALMRCEATIVLDWLDRIPEATMRTRPKLCLLHAFAYGQTGQPERIEPWLETAQAAITSSSTGQISPEEEMDLSIQIEILRAGIPSISGNPQQSIHLAQQALERVQQGAYHHRMLLGLSLGEAYYQLGDLSLATQTLSSAHQFARQSNSTFAQLFIAGELARMRRIQGDLNRAARLYQEIMALAQEQGAAQLSVTGLLNVGLAEVHIERNDLPQAQSVLERAFEILGPGGNVTYMASGHIALACLRLAQGDLVASEDALAHAQRCLAQCGVVYVHADYAAARIQLLLAQGNRAAASTWLQEADVYMRSGERTLLDAEVLAMARVLRAQGHPNQALTLLNDRLQHAEAAGRTGAVIAAQAQAALAIEALGHPSDSVQLLIQTLAIAQPQGYVRTFLSLGKPLVDLLAQTLKPAHQRFVQKTDPTQLNYIKALLLAYGTTDSLGQQVRSHIQEVPDPLSERELEILSLLAANLSTPEIARRLVISENTVKTHRKNIYSKLDVHSREEALLRAKNPNLL